MFKIKFNTTQFRKDLSSFEKHVDSSLETTVKEAAEAIATDAKYLDSDVPVISNSISVIKKDNGYIVDKGSSMDHPELAAYSEFGTGNYASVLLSSYPEEWREMARKFFVNGEGRLPAKPSLYTSFVKNTLNIESKIIDKINA